MSVDPGSDILALGLVGAFGFPGVVSGFLDPGIPEVADFLWIGSANGSWAQVQNSYGR
jgi:hypothetical protein